MKKRINANRFDAAVSDRSIGIDDVRQAAENIAGKIRVTPTAESSALTALCGVPVFLKLEHHQITGSFKLRGATNAIMNLSDEQRSRGVVCVSTGNHGRGLAYAAQREGIRCIVCMSRLVPRNKIDGVESCGAEVRITGYSQDEAQLEADRLIDEESMTFISPFDEFDIIAGQGTLGLEVLEQTPEVETVLVPVSGGGLISGIASVVKAQKPSARVIGVTMERGAAMYESIQAGRPVEVEELPTLADSLGGGIGLQNRFTFRMVQDLVDEMVLVTEDEIDKAIQHAYWHERQITEGAGSVGIAALLSGKVKLDTPAAVIVSGGNINMELHWRLICE